MEYKAKNEREQPKEAELHAGLGDLLMEKGMKEEAEREHRRAKKLEPDFELSETGKKMVSSK